MNHYKTKRKNKVLLLLLLLFYATTTTSVNAFGTIVPIQQSKKTLLNAAARRRTTTSTFNNRRSTLQQQQQQNSKKKNNNQHSPLSEKQKNKKRSTPPILDDGFVFSFQQQEEENNNKTNNNEATTLLNSLYSLLKKHCSDGATFEKACSILRTTTTTNSTTMSLTTLLNQLLKCMEYSRDQRSHYIAQEIFHLLYSHRDKFSYFLLLRCWSESPNQCMDILNDMWLSYTLYQNPEWKPTKFVYAPVFKAWGQQRQRSTTNNPYSSLTKAGQNPTIRAAEAVLNLLNEMWTLYYNTNSTRSLSTTTTTTTTITDIQQQHASSPTISRDESMKPDIVTYITAFPALINTRQIHYANKANDLLQQMWNISRRDNDERLRPNVVIYNLVMEAWINTMKTPSSISNQQHALSFMALDKVVELVDDMWSHNISPDERTFETVIRAFTTCDSSNAHRRALALLNVQWDRYSRAQMNNNNTTFAADNNMTTTTTSSSKSSSPVVMMNVKMYEQIMQVWAAAGIAGYEPKAAQVILFLFADLVYRSTYGYDWLKPTKQTYKIVLGALAKYPSLNHSLRARQILSDMWRQHEEEEQSKNNKTTTTTSNNNKKSTTMPDSKIYALVISTLADSKTIRHGNKIAVALLNELWRKYLISKKNPKLLPTKQVYFATMRVLAERGSATTAIDLLNTMWECYESDGQYLQNDLNNNYRPNHYHYAACFNALATSEHPLAAHEATELLQDLWKRHSLLQNNNNNNDLEPNTFIYNLCLNAIAKSSSPNAPRKANELLRDMWKRHDEETGNNNDNIKPDDVTYTTVCAAMARSCHPMAGIRSHELIREMKRRNIRPSMITYNAVLFAYCQSNDIDNAMKLLKWLNNNNDNKPDLTAYHTVMHTAARLGKPTIVQQLFQDIHDDNNLTPTRQTFETLLLAWVKSNQHEISGIECQGILQTMWQQQQKETEPTSYTYRLVIEAWLQQKDMDSAKRPIQHLVQDMKERYESGKHDDLNPDKVLTLYEKKFLE